MPERISELLDAWRSAERKRDGGPQDGRSYADANDAVNRTRTAYLEAITARAAQYGYADGQRSVEADIAHLREAENRRAAAEPSTAAYRDAAQDVQDRALSIVTQIVEDEVMAARKRRAEKQHAEPDGSG